MRIIKKYPNRRLYDTTLASYITLNDIKKLVFDHVEFKVIDTVSKKDLTQATLLQIITEQETKENPIFTTDLLQQFIRTYQEKSENMVSHYLEKVMSMFDQQKNFYKKQWKTYHQFAEPLLDQQLNVLKQLWGLGEVAKQPIQKSKKK